jgi:hypothetical protein
MQIQIITTTLETKPTAKGSYQQLEVVFKNLTFQGKVESKKLMSFGAGAPSFKVLSTAVGGTIYDIAVVKNDKGFNDWTTATPSDGSAPEPAATTASSTGYATKTTTSPKSTYETPEERALRQVLIVRQSSISSAVSLLAVGGKAPLKVSDVVSAAKELESYVFGIAEVDKGPSGFADIPDFEGEIN